MSYCNGGAVNAFVMLKGSKRFMTNGDSSHIRRTSPEEQVAPKRYFVGVRVADHVFEWIGDSTIRPVSLR